MAVCDGVRGAGLGEGFRAGGPSRDASADRADFPVADCLRVRRSWEATASRSRVVSRVSRNEGRSGSVRHTRREITFSGYRWLSSAGDAGGLSRRFG